MSAGAWTPGGNERALEAWRSAREAGLTSLRSWLCSAPPSPGSLSGGCAAPAPCSMGAADAPERRRRQDPGRPPHLFLCGLDEEEGGLVSFTLEIEPGGTEHELALHPFLRLIWPECID